MNYWQPLLGGILIGLAAFFMHAFLGRVAGISGILGRVLRPQSGDRPWRHLFIVGLIAGGALMYLITPERFSAPVGDPSLFWLGAAGLIVGFGTRLGCGCTSGHGVCGISRFSPRSLIATLTFIAAGAITVAITGGTL